MKAIQAKQQSYLKSLLLSGFLLFVAALVLCLQTAPAKAADVPVRTHPTLKADGHRPTPGNVHIEIKAFHEEGQRHHRVQLTKTWLGQAESAGLGEVGRSAILSSECNFRPSASALRPGYLLFLFRLTPF